MSVPRRLACFQAGDDVFLFLILLKIIDSCFKYSYLFVFFQLLSIEVCLLTIVSERRLVL